MSPIAIVSSYVWVKGVKGDLFMNKKRLQF